MLSKYVEQRLTKADRSLGALLFIETAQNVRVSMIYSSHISGNAAVPHDADSGIHGNVSVSPKDTRQFLAACSTVFNPAMYSFSRIRFLGLKTAQIIRSNAASLSAWIPLLFGTIVFGLT